MRWGDEVQWRVQAEDLLKEEQSLQGPRRALDSTARGTKFVKGPYVHIQFDGGSQDGHGTGGFTIVDEAGKELVRAGLYYGPGYTNNEAEATALMNACEYYDKLLNSKQLNLPVRIWGDSQLIIRHLLGIYKKPSKIRVYDAVQKVRALKRRWKHTAYRHLDRELN